MQTGTLAHYIKRVGRTDGDIYNMTLHVHTPLESFPLLDATGFLRMDKGVYVANFSMVTNRSDILFAGELEVSQHLIPGRPFPIVANHSDNGAPNVIKARF